MNRIIEFLLTRRSVTAKRMLNNAVSDVNLNLIIKTGLRVPDHGGLKPWKIIIIKNERKKIFDENIIYKEFIRNFPDASKEDIDIEKNRFQRAGAVIAVLSSTVDHPRISKWEQYLSAGAVCTNILYAAQSFGYAAQWITEWYAYNRRIIKALGGKQKDRVAGFIYIGKVKEQPKERRRPEIDEIVSYY